MSPGSHVVISIDSAHIDIYVYHRELTFKRECKNVTEKTDNATILFPFLFKIYNIKTNDLYI